MFSHLHCQFVAYEKINKNTFFQGPERRIQQRVCDLVRGKGDIESIWRRGLAASVLNDMYRSQNEAGLDFLSNLDVAEDLAKLINDSDLLLREASTDNQRMLMVRKARLSAFQALCRLQRGRVPFGQKSLVEEYVVSNSYLQTHRESDPNNSPFTLK